MFPNTNLKALLFNNQKNKDKLLNHIYSQLILINKNTYNKYFILTSDNLQIEESENDFEFIITEKFIFEFNETVNNIITKIKTTDFYFDHNYHDKIKKDYICNLFPGCESLFDLVYIKYGYSLLHSITNHNTFKFYNIEFISYMLYEWLKTKRIPVKLSKDFKIHYSGFCSDKKINIKFIDEMNNSNFWEIFDFLSKNLQPEKINFLIINTYKNSYHTLENTTRVLKIFYNINLLLFEN